MTFRDYHPKSAAKLKMRTREEEGEMMKLGLNWQIRVAPNAKILTLLLLFKMDSNLGFWLRQNRPTVLKSQDPTETGMLSQ